MPDTPLAVYLVDAQSDPVAIRIEGRASFQNSACIQEFFKNMIAQGKSRFVMDFSACSSMDSTFLGVLAGTALQLRKLKPQGSLVLARVEARNLELVRNLGLHRLLTIDTGETVFEPATGAKPLTCTARSEVESARMVLQAHENLIQVDETNRKKFEDVLSFLKKRIEEG